MRDEIVMRKIVEKLEGMERKLDKVDGKVERIEARGMPDKKRECSPWINVVHVANGEANRRVLRRETESLQRMRMYRCSRAYEAT